VSSKRDQARPDLSAPGSRLSTGQVEVIEASPDASDVTPRA
jgi:hypothetical protein